MNLTAFKITVFSNILFLFSCPLMATDYAPNDVQLEKYLQNYYLSNKCPSGIGIKMSELKVKGCLRSSTFFKENGVVILDYLLFKTHKNMEGFEDMDRNSREVSLKKATIQLGYRVGKLRFKNAPSINGEIQRTPFNFVIDKKNDEVHNLKKWIKANAVVSLTFSFKQRWYVGFLDKSGSFFYKESYDVDPNDPVITPLHFLEK